MRSRAGLIGLLGAEAVSMVGSRMSLIALPWLVLVTTGNPTLMGVVAAAEMLPFVLAGALGGPLVDRIGARPVSIVADVGSAAAMAAVAIGYDGGLAMLIVLVAIAGALRGVGDTSRKVLSQPMAAAAGTPLVRVTAVYDGIGRLATLLGAPAGGLLIAWFGVATTIWIDAATFAASAVLVATLVRPRAATPAPAPATTAATAAAADTPATPTDTGTAPPAREPYLVALRRGVTHLMRDRLAFGVIAMLFALNLFNQAHMVVFIPLWVRDEVGTAAALGLVSSALALGAVLGNVAFTVLATRLPRYLTFTLGFLVGGAPRFIAMGVSDDLVVVLVVTFLSGIAIASVNPIIGVMMLERTPPALQARVFGLATAVSWAGIPLGGVLGGWAVQLIGLSPALLLAGGLYFAVALTPVFGGRSWRELGGRRSPAPATAT
ncbi:MFS transporter [Actinomycetes bacterium KLBMP 9797]